MGKWEEYLLSTNREINLHNCISSFEYWSFFFVLRLSSWLS